MFLELEDDDATTEVQPEIRDAPLGHADPPIAQERPAMIAGLLNTAVVAYCSSVIGRTWIQQIREFRGEC